MPAQRERVTADALDSRDDDWDVNEFDGQTHFSDDGQLYQPIDPTVYTGNSDATFVPPTGTIPRTTLPGDMPGYFDYLRAPGAAEEFHPRAGIGSGSSDDKRPVIRFENPWEPVRQINQRRRRGVLQRFDQTVSLGDDAQGVQEDIRDWQAQARAKIVAAGGRMTPALDKQLSSAFFVLSQNANTSLALRASGDVHAAVLRIMKDALGGRAPSATAQQDVLRFFQAINTQLSTGKSALGSIASTIGSVAKGATSIVSGIARPIGGLITSPAHLVSDIAHGKNVFSSLKDTVARDLGNVGAVAPYAQAVLSVVPGVGSGVNAAIAAGSALAHGQNITDALVSGVKNMVPGGPLAQQALDTAYKIAKGGNVIASVAEAARNNLPGGELAKRAFDTGLALAHGANLQKTLVSQGTDIAKGQAMSFFQDEISKLSPLANRVTGQNAPQFIGQVAQQLNTLVPTQYTNIAHAILQNPALRSLPIEDLARRMNVSTETARNAVASLVSTVAKAGNPSIPHMAPAVELARRISSNMNVDQALAHFASNMAPIAGSPNVRRARPIAMHWFRTARGFTPHIGEAMGLDATGTAYIVESGDSMSKIASKLTGSSGRVGELISANKQVSDPNKIFPGQRLNLPASWMTKPVAPTAPPPLTTTASPNANPSPMPILAAPILASAASSVMPTISEQAKSSGAAVKAWQNILIRDGFASAGTDDGFFGPNTTSRTKAWQQKRGLAADGVVGPNTWKAALATIPTVLTPSAMPTPSVAPTPSIQTPLGNLPIPAIFQPTMATISENPLATPIAAAPLPALPPALAVPVSTSMATIPPVGTVLGQTSVTATQTGPSEVTVTQPPIGGDVPTSKPGAGALGAVALALGALYFVGKGKVGL